MHEMKGFVDKILTELKSNSAINSEPLIKMLSESIDKSIVLGEMNENIYSNLKNGLVSINNSIKNPVLESIVNQFVKIEETDLSKTYQIAKRINLTSKIKAIKESKSGATPTVSSQIEVFENYLSTGALDFALCESFIATFSQHKLDPVISKQVKAKNDVF